MAIVDVDKDNYQHYRYYSNTDKCVYVIRVEVGKIYHQWIKDPLYHNHDVHKAWSSSRPVLLPPESFSATVMLAPAGAWKFPADALQAAPVQAQNCVNPHPGNFKYWWGPPFDSCNSPMYRQFGDGCTHYQIYNRCANAWDSRIFWTFCHPAPHY